MAEPRDDSQRASDMNWLYRRDDEGKTSPQAETPRVTNIANDADIERREREFLAQRRREQQELQAQRRREQQARQAARHEQNQSNRSDRHRAAQDRQSVAPAAVPPASPPGRRPPRDGSGRPKRRRRRIVRTVIVLLVAWLVYTIAVPINAWASMGTADWEPDASTRPDEQPGTAILLVGSDSRSDLTDEEKAELGTGDAEGSRTDTIMILYVPPSGDSVLISVPRDSYVTIPGYGREKINASYSYGGAQLLVQTVENATGLRMDGYMEVGFDGFANIVDAVNGVDVCLDSEMQDEKANIDLPAGCQTLNGANALGYVRHRYGDPEGDLGRARRQREVMSKVGSKLKSPATVLNPIRWWNVCHALSGALTKGDGMGIGVMTAAARGMLSISSGGGTSLQVPVSNPSGWSDDGTESVVIWDHDEASAMFEELANGDTSNISQYAS